MRKIVLDIETKNIFQDTGSNDPVSLDISIVGIYDSLPDTYRCFEEHEFKTLWPILEAADLIIGFNIEHFDMPILNKYYPGDLARIKQIDLMKEIKNSLGRRISLQVIAEATLKRGKSGHGLDAVRWWKQGEIEKIKKYCIEDVKLTKELYDFALQNNFLCYLDNKEEKKIPLKTASWETPAESAMTFSLPF